MKVPRLYKVWLTKSCLIEDETEQAPSFLQTVKEKNLIQVPVKSFHILIELFLLWNDNGKIKILKGKKKTCWFVLI